MKYFTGLESDNFYKLDNKNYELQHNDFFLNYLNEKKKEGYSPNLTINQMQIIIDNIVNFYEFKYPNSLFESQQYCNEYYKTLIKDIRSVSSLLDFKQLFYRLNHYSRFIMPNIEGFYCIKKDFVKEFDITIEKIKKIHNLTLRQTVSNLLQTTLSQLKNISDDLVIDKIIVRIKENGKISKYELTKLIEEGYIDDASNIYDIYGLVDELEQCNKCDYSELEKAIFNYETDIEIRNMLFALIPFKMIYSKTTLPHYGYERAKSFVRTFNKEFNLNLNLKLIDDIINQDYTQEKIRTQNK